MSAAASASSRGGWDERSAARTPSPNPSPAVLLSEATRYEKKRAGSLSPSSRESQAMQLSPPTLSFTHLFRSVVLPKPAGAERRVNLRPGSRVRLSTRRGLATSLGRACDGRSLVEASGSAARIIPVHLQDDFTSRVRGRLRTEWRAYSTSMIPARKKIVPATRSRFLARYSSHRGRQAALWSPVRTGLRGTL